MESNPYQPPSLPPALEIDDIGRQLQGIAYPLMLSFKILALASQATVTDATGRTVIFTRQKLLKFKEHVEIWTDSRQATRLADIKANKVIDWSARYQFTDARGVEVGSVGRRGWRSLWKAHYETFKPNAPTPEFLIQEENPWSKVIDSVLGEIPIVGMFTGYFCHPTYVATRADGSVVMRITKQPAFFEGKFRIDRIGELAPREELNLFLSFLMMLLLERRRG